MAASDTNSASHDNDEATKITIEVAGRLYKRLSRPIYQAQNGAKASTTERKSIVSGSETTEIHHVDPVVHKEDESPADVAIKIYERLRRAYPPAVSRFEERFDAWKATWYAKDGANADKYEPRYAILLRPIMVSYILPNQS